MTQGWLLDVSTYKENHLEGHLLGPRWRMARGGGSRTQAKDDSGVLFPWASGGQLAVLFGGTQVMQPFAVWMLMAC